MPPAGYEGHYARAVFLKNTHLARTDEAAIVKPMLDCSRYSTVNSSYLTGRLTARMSPVQE